MPASIQIGQMTLAEKLLAMETLWDELCRREKGPGAALAERDFG